MIEQQQREQDIGQQVKKMHDENIGWGWMISSSRKQEELKKIENLQKMLEAELSERVTS